MSVLSDPFLQCLFSAGWQHPGFAPYQPLLRRLRRMTLIRAGIDPRTVDSEKIRAAGHEPPGERFPAGLASRNTVSDGRLKDVGATGRVPSARAASDGAASDVRETERQRSAGNEANDISGWDVTHWLDLFNTLACWRGLRSGDGVPLRFVAGSDIGAVDYEARILRHGEISCRLQGAGARHDFHNGLVWLRFPRFKAACNILHCKGGKTGGHGDKGSGQEGGGGQTAGKPGRGHRRDALTLLDESGAVWPAPPLAWVEALRQRHWRALFSGQRAALLASAAPVIVGHGLMERLHQPYKSLTARLLVCPGSAPRLDRALAAQLRRMATDDTLRPAACLPLPLAAWPGWHAGNVEPAFYDDESVFRPLPAC